MNFNFSNIKIDFPILNRNINGHTLIYLDSAATTQKPLKVINAEKKFFLERYSAVHRGIHTLSLNATEEIESIRNKIAFFINALSSKEIVFVKNSTEGINLVVYSWGENNLSEGDNIIITQMEHHSNIVPWQILAKKINFEIRILPIKKTGELNTSCLSSLIDKKTKLLSMIHISNVLGTINPIKNIIKQAKAHGLITLVDGAQAIMHEKIDVQDIDCDFYVFSGHKMYGPTGIGVLYGREILLNNMKPWQGGGAMVTSVNLNGTTNFSEPPWRFEAGTQNIGGIIGLGAALDYIYEIGLNEIKKYEKDLTEYTLDRLRSISDCIIYGPKNRAGIISFNLSNLHSYDVGTFLDQYGIAIRTGHHCAMPLVHFYQVKTMCRVSLAIYNTKKDIDRLIQCLLNINKFLKN